MGTFAPSLHLRILFRNNKKREKKIMGEVRKRKNSGEAKNGTSAAQPAAQAKSGGLGLIPVVLISALLAGSGCHVIRKDTAKSIADLSDFVGELKAKNVETGQLVEKLRNTVATKDALVESVKAAINKNEKQAEQTFEKYHQVITGEDDFRSGIGQFIHRRLWRENVGRRTYLGMAIDELKKLAERYFRFREQVLQHKIFLTAYFCAVKV